MTDIERGEIKRTPYEAEERIYILEKVIVKQTNEIDRLRAALDRIAYGKYHWEADAQEEARAALEVK